MKLSNTVNIENRKARFDYQILETLVAGIQLKGTEIKSIRSGKAGLADSYCVFKGNELYVRNLHISEYENASFFSHEPMRERKLLLNRHEISKWQRKVKEQGLTIVPTKLFLSEKGYAKLNLALAKGKKAFDKREDIKKKDTERELQRKF
ncbi:MAG TPA: SsrA-binding protein SmpB [Bacteroidia bacterium]|nr:SsrA-binding protein SmpB [Bacteroidia bacterium]